MCHWATSLLLGLLVLEASVGAEAKHHAPMKELVQKVCPGLPSQAAADWLIFSKPSFS